MKHDDEFRYLVETFNWESKEQKESYLAWVKHESQFGRVPELRIDTQFAFICQKMHEASEYWRETVSTQLEQAKKDIYAELFREIEQLRELTKSQSQTIDALLQSRSGG